MELTHAMGYLLIRMSLAARGFSESLADVGISLTLGEAYAPDVIADFERDSGTSISDIQKIERVYGVKI